jgi:hypothetical protein
MPVKQWEALDCITGERFPWFDPVVLLDAEQETHFFRQFHRIGQPVLIQFDYLAGCPVVKFLVIILVTAIKADIFKDRLKHFEILRRDQAAMGCGRH